MHIDKFLDLDGLSDAQQTPPSVRRAAKVEATIGSIYRAGEAIDSLGLNSRFSPHNGLPLTLMDECNEIAEATTQTVSDYFKAEGFTSSPQQKNKSRKRQMKKAPEIAALLEEAGITREEELLLFDACGGAGHIGFASHIIREALGLSTTSVCIDMSSREKKRFRFFKNSMAPASPAHFIRSDVNNYDFVRAQQGQTLLLAKHACGPAAEFLVRRVSRLSPQERPQTSLIMTCCHGKSREDSTFNPNLSQARLTSQDWERLLIAAEWVNSNIDERAIIGRVAMRVTDVMRTEHVQTDETDVRVLELLPSTHSKKNHAIKLEQRS